MLHDLLLGFPSMSLLLTRTLSSDQVPTFWIKFDEF